MGNWTTVSAAASVVPPQLPASIALSEVGSRVLVGPLNRTQMTLQVTWPTPSTGPAPVLAHYSLNVPAGVEAAAGDALVHVLGANSYIQFPAWAPTSGQSWSATISLDTGQAVSATITSAAVAINAIGSAAANNVSNLAVGAPQYVPDATGTWFFGFQVSANSLLTDPNLFCNKITAQWGTVLGGVFYAASGQASDASQMDGLEFQGASYSIFWGGFRIPAAGDTSRTRLRIQAWSQSRSQAAATPMTFTAQPLAVGGTTDHIDIIPTQQAPCIPGGDLLSGTVAATAVVPGALSDPNGGPWGAAGAPVICYYGLPSYSGYNTGVLVFNTSDGKVYRNSGYPNGWIRTTDPADLIAGSLAAGVVLTGSVTVSSGTVTVNIDGTNFVRVSDSQGAWPCTAQMTNTGFQVTTTRNSAQALLRIAQVGNADGELFLKSHDGNSSLSITPEFSNPTGLVLAGYFAMAKNGVASYYIPYYVSS